LIQSKGVAVVAAAAIITAFPLLLIVLVTTSHGAPAQAAGPSPGTAGLGGTPSALARASIPADYLAWYIGAAQTCQGLPWAVLAGIGKVESDHGQSNLPGVHAGANAAGAEGPMQFLPATFGEFAVDADPAQPVSPYDPADAIYTAARMLCADGARGGSPSGVNQAIFAYNHASWYVAEVLSWAARCASPSRSATAAPLPPGTASRP
jgi:Transglycosylase SLT domain